MEIRTIPVVNAIIMKGNKILLGKRSLEKKFLPGYWTTPGGKVEPGEKIIDALRREVKEETNLDIKKSALLRLSEQFHDDHYHIIFDFKVDPKNYDFEVGSDLVELNWFEKKEITKLRVDKENKKFLQNLDFNSKDILVDL